VVHAAHAVLRGRRRGGDGHGRAPHREPPCHLLDFRALGGLDPGREVLDLLVGRAAASEIGHLDGTLVLHHQLLGE